MAMIGSPHQAATFLSARHFHNIVYAVLVSSTIPNVLAQDFRVIPPIENIHSFDGIECLAVFFVVGVLFAFLRSVQMVRKSGEDVNWQEAIRDRSL